MDAELIYQRLVGDIRQKRRARGLTQQRLAEVSGLTRSMVIRIEQADPTVNSGALMRVIAALGCEAVLEVARLPTLDEIDEVFGED